MNVVSKSEALSALNDVRVGNEQFSIAGGADKVCDVTVYFVQVWDGEFVEYRDVMFIRRNGRVKVYEGVVQTA
jgi:hypothetical protein